MIAGLYPGNRSRSIEADPLKHPGNRSRSHELPVPASIELQYSLNQYTMNGRPNTMRPNENAIRETNIT